MKRLHIALRDRWTHAPLTPRGCASTLVEHGPEDGIPVVLVHGNLSTGRFFEHLFEGAPDRYRLIAPDMRGFGDTQPMPIEATHGLRDWADDVHALMRALGIERPPHLAGWSTGGAAIALYAIDHGAASLTFIDPVSPHGYGRRRSRTSRAPAAAASTRTSPRDWRRATAPPRRRRRR